MAYGVFFLLCLLVFTEINTGSSSAGSVLRYKRGTQAEVIKEAEAETTSAGDEEKARATATPSVATRNTEQETLSEKDKTLEKHVGGQLKMANTFSWQNIRYTVSVSGSKRRLLDDVSGFVVPGKLTALMGESGAGKVCSVGSFVVACAHDSLDNLAQRACRKSAHRGYHWRPLLQRPSAADRLSGADRVLPTDGHAHYADYGARGAKVFREAAAAIERAYGRKGCIVGDIPAPIELNTADILINSADKCLKMCGLELFADAIVGSLGVEQKKLTTIGVELAAKVSFLSTSGCSRF